MLRNGFGDLHLAHSRSSEMASVAQDMDQCFRCPPRNSIRGSLYLLFKEGMDGLRFAQVNRGIIPLVDNLVILGLGEHR